MKNSLTIGWSILAIAAIGAAGCQKNETPAEPTMAASSTPAEAPAAAEEPAKTLPDKLPEFQLMNREGKMQSIKSWPGKSLIINFWATWCGPCRKEIPLLIETHQAEAQNGFEVVGIALDFRDDVLKYAAEIKMDYPMLMGEQDGFAAANSFGVESMGLPFTVFTDNQERIVTLYIGEITKQKLAVLLDGVRQVNAGKLSPLEGRAWISVELEKILMGGPEKH
ncbi:MAG TPA: TlpA disulfide reductase family protein [Steroidobacteraceae bacterium]|nr:TlpA disulfide reductase family protein [Steroidobacteraceae bacterium]